MVKIIYKTKQLTKEDKKKVRKFVKDYSIDGLTIIFSERWDERFFHRKKNKYTWLKSNLSKCIGRYYPKSSGFKFGSCGVKNISYPIILVKINEEWWDTFLHEFGHYLDDSLNGGLKKHHHKEKYANAFCELKRSYA